MTSLGEVMFNCMTMYGNRTAQVIDETGEKITYGELLSRCISVSLKLVELGFGEGHIISSCLYNSENSCVPFIATSFIGAIPASFDPDMPELDAVSLLKLVQPRIIFVDDKSLPFMEGCLDIANIETRVILMGKISAKYDSFDEFLSYSAKNEAFRVAPIEDGRNTAVIIFTSGTTGIPKGICKSHYSLLKAFENERLAAEKKFNNQPNFEPDGISVTYTTLYWVTGVSSLIINIFQGAPKLVCHKFDPSRFWRTVQIYKGLTIFIPPFMIKSLKECKPEQLQSLSENVKVILTGSCLVTRHHVKQLKDAFPGVPIVTVYSQTEMGYAATICRVDNLYLASEDSEKPLTVGKITKPHEVAWKIVDPETEEILGPNKEGEFRVKSDTTMTGYYKMDSSEAFDSDGYLRTGDICYYDEDNYLYVVDRLRVMFKYRGWHVIPTIVEDVIQTHPGVKEAAVVGIPHEQDVSHPAALVVMREGHADVSQEEIEKFVASKVSNVQRLRGGVVITDKPLPRTVTGKIRRKEVLKLVLESQT